MNDIFYTILNNVGVTSVILVAIMILRIVFKNIPKTIYPVIWGIAGLKLLFPFDIYTSFGVLSGEKTIEKVTTGNSPVIIRTGVESLDHGVNNYIGNISKGNIVSANNALHTGDVLAIGWMIGIVCMFGYLLVSYLMMKRKVSQSILIENGVSICDEVSSPFLLGIIKPHIYIPSGLEQSKYEYVLAHERMHIKRRDSLWKILAFCLLSVYWFNPLCWIAYVLFCKDVELACDESVIRQYGPSWRADYCQALLECSNGSRKVIFIPLSFGEVGVKERVRRVLCYKKTKPIVIFFAIIMCAVIILCLGTKHNVELQDTQDDNQYSNITASSKEKNNLSENEFYGKTPTIDLNATSGADGARLYYVDEETIIFGGSFGLFVYDTKNHKYIQSVDLASIGYSATQGDECCDIYVKKDGSEVYLRKMNDKDNMLVYHVADNRFEKMPYDIDEASLYSGVSKDELDTATFINTDGKKKKCWLTNSWRTLGEIGYHGPDNDDLVYPLFVEEHLQGAKYFVAEDIKDIVKAEITWRGKHYVCENEKYLSQIEKGYAKAKKEKGKSGCPFDDVMHLTKADGTVGMVLPAMDSCKACIMGDGWYEQNHSLSMSIYDMIQKGMFIAVESVDTEDKDEQ